jgi:hypothetical protein
MNHDLSLAARMWSEDGASGDAAGAPPDPAPGDADDAARFRHWLQDGAGDAPPGGARPALSIGEVLGAVGRSLHDKEQAFNQALERTGRTGDPVEGLKVQQRLSELYIEHGLATKVIAKTTQSIETLMKLQ